MSIRIVPFVERHIDAVRKFNQRLNRNDQEIRLSESLVSPWLPNLANRQIFQEYIVAEDDGGNVRGGYILKHQLFLVGGKTISLGICESPISEGLVDKTYTLVGALLIRDAMKRQPFLYALGMGGFNEPYPRMLRALQWKLSLVPFYFNVRNPRNFLKNIVFLRKGPFAPHLFDFLASSGVGTCLIAPVQQMLGIRSIVGGRSGVECVDSFDDRVDSLWEASKHQYAMASVRDARTLNILYPKERPFHRLLVNVRGEYVGWSVVLATQMTNHRHFGAMAVGSIVDCLAHPGRETAVIQASTKYLSQQGVDVIVSNQNHRLWRAAMCHTGFIRGYSNFAFGVSRPVEELLAPYEREISRIHITRADGDGPINL